MLSGDECRLRSEVQEAEQNGIVFIDDDIR